MFIVYFMYLQITLEEENLLMVDLWTILILFSLNLPHFIFKFHIVFKPPFIHVLAAFI